MFIMLKYLDGPGLCLPWQTDSMRDVFENLTQQEKNDITQESQVNKNKSFSLFFFFIKFIILVWFTFNVIWEIK